MNSVQVQTPSVVVVVCMHACVRAHATFCDAMTNFLGIVYKGSQNCTDLTCSSFLSEELYVDIQVDSLANPRNREHECRTCV